MVDSRMYTEYVAVPQSLMRYLGVRSGAFGPSFWAMFWARKTVRKKMVRIAYLWLTKGLKASIVLRIRVPSHQIWRFT